MATVISSPLPPSPPPSIYVTITDTDGQRARLYTMVMHAPWTRQRIVEGQTDRVRVSYGAQRSWVMPLVPWARRVMSHDWAVQSLPPTVVTKS